MPAESGHISLTRIEPFFTPTFTGKERDKETGYGYFGARYMDHELMTMWLSIDPMADKYPSMSPYAYCAWNPVKLVDPEGREIYYKEGRSFFVYKKNAEGQYGFYNCRTGEKYSGDNKGYVDDLTKAIGKLKDGVTGNKLITYFEGNQDRPLFIQKGKENYQEGTCISWNNTDKTLLPVGTKPSDPVQIEATETFVTLGHELAHARDAYKFGDKFNKMSRQVKEQRAMLIENQIRREHGLRQRTYYGSKDEGYSVDYDSFPAIVLPILPVKASWGDKVTRNISF